MAFFIGNTFCRICQSNEEALKSELVSCVHGLFSKGLVTSGGGNHSARLPGSDSIWITPSGYPRSHIRSEDLVNIDLAGKVIEGTLKPSIEVPFHTEIYKHRPDVNSVVHAHCPYTQGITLSGILERQKAKDAPISVHLFDQDPKLPLVHGEGALVLGDIPIVDAPPEDLGIAMVPYLNPGARELARLVGDASIGKPLRPIRIILLMNHGVIGIGSCVHEARAFVEIMEEWSRFLTIANVFGGAKYLVRPADLQGLGARYARAIKFGGRYQPR